MPAKYSIQRLILGHRLAFTRHGDILYLQRSGIVLAGGFSSRFGQDKGLTLLAGKPLIKHVLNSLENVAEEIIVVVSSKAQIKKYEKLVSSSCKVLVESADLHGPIAGAMTGFEAASGECSLLLPCDTPFVSPDVLSLLAELCINRNAAIPRWPNCYVEPLQAAYRNKPAAEAAAKALCTGETKMQAMVNKLNGVRYVSTLVIEELDSGLKTFFNVNTPLDLRKAETMLSQGMGRKSRQD
jgi:molybdopterin-guanine dinucleotide biosynthesis protein A